MSNSQDSNTIILCPDGNSCPTLTFQEDGNFLFRDDFGGQIQLTSDQLRQLFQEKEKIEHLITTSSSRK